MLEYFWFFYFIGCLIFELIIIYNGKYVVCVLVLVNGEILVIGLGFVDIVEVVEDLVREWLFVIFIFYIFLCLFEVFVEFFLFLFFISEKL